MSHHFHFSCFPLLFASSLCLGDREGAGIEAEDCGKVDSVGGLCLLLTLGAGG